MAKPPGEQDDVQVLRHDGGHALTENGEGRVASAEQDRLETLRSYRILDTAPEPGFDRVTKLVADLFDAPIALVSLVDDCRQWFKSAHGLDVAETPRDISFCQYVIADDQPMVITDATQDPRFADNPLVTGEPYIRFYAGMPLRAPNGVVLGTLCVIDEKVRAVPDARDMERLADFAAIIMAEAELRRTAIERDETKLILERALDFSSIAVWQYHPRNDAMEWQGAVAELWGSDYADALSTGDAAAERILPEDRPVVRKALDEAVEKGVPYMAEFRVQHPERGVRWLLGRADWDGWPDAAVLTGINADITEQKSRQENATLLMRELHHRMRNLFATVGAIISLTRHSASDVDDYVERISSRLDALNRAQNVLLGANFMTGSMHALLREVEAAFPRIRWSGPDLLLPENALVAMALLFNELATNAAKHGALSVDDGRVDVRWSQDAEGDDARQFHLTWAESGGNGRVVPPDRTSFGTLLMERSVCNNLGGTIERYWKPTGLVCEIFLPARWREA
ncbi:MAG: histidine kinase [Sphingopyxis macrogoltabida]|uniref:histidine kinase n=1 Tax=Sphingopyxis macrogoltabida TaxID=33050 RepID=A0A2W5LDG7_SPHMC|nr:MAG: histidine kinase [Sphingopyxis macrogoltabida]